MTTLVLMAATTLTGLMAGLFFAYACSVAPALRKVDDRVYVEVMQRVNAAIQNGVFGLCFLGALVLPALGVGLALLDKANQVALWAAAGLACYGLALVITCTGNIPLNIRLDRAGPAASLVDPDRTRAAFENRWNRFNVLRTLFSMAALVLLGQAGLRTSPLGEIHLVDVRVPASHLLGRRGMGLLVLDHVMKREILLSFVVNTGEMAHRLQRCLKHATSRRQFGRPIGANQLVAKKLVDARIGLETARKWLYDAAALLESGGDATEHVAIAKLVTSEANVAAGLAAVQVFGGSGYLTENGLEADLRAAVGSTIYSGTNEIQYTRIASAMGL